MSDMKIANPAYIGAPGGCCLCGGKPQEGGDGFLIDTGRVNPHIGFMYVCNLCRESMVDLDDEYVKFSVVEDRLVEAQEAQAKYEAAYGEIAAVMDHLQKEAT